MDKAIAFNIETYEQMKKDGEVDALQEYIKEFTEDQIYLGELEEKWADKRMEIEQSLVEQ